MLVAGVSQPCATSYRGSRTMNSPARQPDRLMPRGCSHHDRRNDAGGYRGENIVTVHLPPFISPGRRSQMAIMIINVLASIPILILDFGAFLPLFMADVVMIVGVVFREGERAGKRGRED